GTKQGSRKRRCKHFKGASGAGFPACARETISARKPPVTLFPPGAPGTQAGKPAPPGPPGTGSGSAWPAAQFGQRATGDLERGGRTTGVGLDRLGEKTHLAVALVVVDVGRSRSRVAAPGDNGPVNRGIAGAAVRSGHIDHAPDETVINHGRAQ